MTTTSVRTQTEGEQIVHDDKRTFFSKTSGAHLLPGPKRLALVPNRVKVHPP